MPASADRITGKGRIDRNRTVNFTFNGKAYQGYAGDTLASALLANGVRIVARSLKYHRPRGIMTCGVEEPNALVQLGGDEDEPNVRATEIELTEGLAARSVNCWPGPDFDVGALSSVFSPLLVAGFYYKTFMWPPRAWNVYGRIIRRAAGLGSAPRRIVTHRYEKRFHHCDVLIVGAGPAGLSAALSAARTGARVLLTDDRREPGGSLLDREVTVGGEPAVRWLHQTVAELDAMRNVLRLSRGSAFGYYDHNLLAIAERGRTGADFHERFWRVRARQVILTTGAIERPLAFPDNDRPGVMLASAARAYANRYGVRVADKAIVFTNNNSAYDAAFELQRAGVGINAVIDIRRKIRPDLRARCEQNGIPILGGHGIVGIDGARQVRGVRIAPIGSFDGEQLLTCDALLISGGWNPAVHLHSQSGGTPVYDADNACFVPGESVQAEQSAGAARGEFDLQGCLADGATAGISAASACGYQGDVSMTLSAAATLPLDVQACWALPGSQRSGKVFVDYQNDVTFNDIQLAVRENFVSVEHVKRYTTAGMGTDQGKLGNVNVIGALAELTNKKISDVGTTTFRPPYTAVSFAALTGSDVGELLVPKRHTAITEWNTRHGAVLFEAGSHYRRPSYYARAGEDDNAAIQREALAARQSLGIYDGSPLGKFMLAGPDVVTFLNLLYINQWSDLQPGHGRYGWMLREDGRLLDDGVTFRLNERQYWMFCGTGAADHVYLHMTNLLQLQRPDLRVRLIPVTAQWANICLCGPQARACLQSMDVDIDLSSDAFGFMTIQSATLAGFAVYIARVSYTGELSFEISVRRRNALALWEQLIQAGEAHAITPIGSEASGVMRVEKGFIAAGFEGDGIVNPVDAGLRWMLDLTKPDFIGKRMVQRDIAQQSPRPQVVGIIPDDTRYVPAEGTPIVEVIDDQHYPTVHGHVTQGVFSPTLDHSIALALLNNGRERIGEKINLSTAAGDRAATVVKPCFVDPEHQRMRS